MEQCFKCEGRNVARVSDGVYQCRSCAARMAHGERMPRIVVQPHPTDRRFVVLTIEERNVAASDGGTPPSEPLQIVLDRQLAGLTGCALTSMG
jgi:hypothetical protein